MKRYVIKRPGAGAATPDRLARYREELNAEQFAVATSPPGAALVIAGAGSGKTRAITYRVAYLIEQGVAPSRICLATFTNRAAREMLRRVDELTGGTDAARRVWGGTFHRIGNLILRRHAEAIGFTSNYTILDAEDARDLLQSCVADAGTDTRAKRFPKPEVLQDILSFATNTDQPITDVVAARYPHFAMLAEQITRVDRSYLERKRERNLMDYDDLLLNWKRLLESARKSREFTPSSSSTYSLTSFRIRTRCRRKSLTCSPRVIAT
jgi:DNA helicase-2/ATP-dependent DNA helicase PcrA